MQAFWSVLFERFAATTRLGHRKSTLVFGVQQSSCLQEVEGSGEDLEVLRRTWNWEKLAVDVVALANGMAPDMLHRLAGTQAQGSSVGESSQEEEAGGTAFDVFTSTTDDGVVGELEMETPRQAPRTRQATASPAGTVDQAEGSEKDAAYDVKAEASDNEDPSQEYGYDESSFEDQTDVSSRSGLHRR